MAIKDKKRGFALLISIIFMSVMLSFGLSLGSLGYKQQVLAATSIGSQYAFYAADAALECALYADQQQNLFIFPPSAPSSVPAMTCDGVAPVSATTVSYTANEWVVATRFSLESNTTRPRCADVTIYKPAPGASGVTYLFAQGYDVSCTKVSNPNGARFVSRGISAHYGSASVSPPAGTFITATGGTETTDGNFKVHTFTSNGTFTVISGSETGAYLVVGGGGGGGFRRGGGGGGGGVLYNASYALSPGSYSVVVGSRGVGGVQAVDSGYGGSGGASSFNGISASGGGGGAQAGYPGRSGGSGGGGSDGTPGGTGTSGQGNAGGAGENVFHNAGGGGGAGSAGQNAGSNGGNGGSGLAFSISGASHYYGCGGGGDAFQGNPGTGCPDGGGRGGSDFFGWDGQPGTDGLGEGGGGGQDDLEGGPGGSGVVIIRYQFQ